MLVQPKIMERECRRVVIVDDDDLFRESLGLNLAEEGYEVVDFDSGEGALDYLLNGEAAHAVLLDWRMPGLDGLGVLRFLRQSQIETPVIFLTVLSDEIYEEAALQWGAVDFIDKSRRLSIILQRLKLITEGAKAILSSGEGVQESPTLRKGPLELRLDIKRAFWHELQVDLTVTEFAIVSLLINQQSADVSYRQIYDLVRGKDFVAGYGPEGYRANVRSFIKRIRKKFRDLDTDFDQIENYPGFGYRWREEASG
jgi:two-component system response regulator ChvI